MYIRVKLFQNIYFCSYVHVIRIYDGSGKRGKWLSLQPYLCTHYVLVIIIIIVLVQYYMAQWRGELKICQCLYGVYHVVSHPHIHTYTEIAILINIYIYILLKNRNKLDSKRIGYVCARIKEHQKTTASLRQTLRWAHKFVQRVAKAIGIVVNF
jgi:hypothetical protein